MKILVNLFLCNNKKVLLLTTLLFSATIFADTVFPDYEFSDADNWSEESVVNGDLFEPINRQVYHLNDFIYLRILDPITNVYINCTSESVRKSFKNFFTNLKYPIRFVSNVLQIKMREAYFESLKFGINTTIGVLGINSPSDKYSFLSGIPEEDLGQVLAVWGIPEGPYLMVPILGPSTLRDLPARIVGRNLNPFDVSSDNWDTVESEWIDLLNTVEVLSINEELLPRYMSIKKTSIDPYTALRSAYLQQRAQEISQ